MDNIKADKDLHMQQKQLVYFHLQHLADLHLADLYNRTGEGCRCLPNWMFLNKVSKVFLRL